MRRVVVTGMGIVSPHGRGVAHNWECITQGKSGIRKIEDFEVSDMAVQIAGQVPFGNDAPWKLDSESVVEAKELRKIDKFILFGLAAGIDAVEDSGWKPETEEEKDRTGVIVGAGIGGLQTIYENAIALHEKGPRRVSPFFIPATLINLVSGHLSIKYGFRGPNHSVVTACSSGTHAIGDAARLIQYGDADVMIAGGAETAVNRLGMCGFIQAKALTSSFNETPEKASCPWDKSHSGFVMGEGAGILVLEEYEHAKKRGAKIYAEIDGYGLSGDGYHVTAPAPDGNGAYRAMESALRNSTLSIDDIDYVNAHGTSTPVGDPMELGAVQRLFANRLDTLAMSSTKSSIGHLLGAAGAVEAIFSIMAVQTNIAPPTLNLVDPIDEVKMNLVPLKAQEKKIKAAMSNSFGFGGTNSSVIVKAV